MSNMISHWIDGKNVSVDGRTSDVFNPATGEVQAQVALADEAMVNKAVASSLAAFPDWAATPPCGAPVLCSNSANFWRII